jgi:hypothetical protein
MAQVEKRINKLFFWESETQLATLVRKGFCKASA